VRTACFCLGNIRLQTAAKAQKKSASARKLGRPGPIKCVKAYFASMFDAGYNDQFKENVVHTMDGTASLNKKKTKK
jgi:hypothetical protein